MYTVILVDDEPVTFKSLRTMIEKRCSGFNIIGTASNGQEGLALAREMKPNLVITDIKMPVMDGIEFAMRIREELPETLTVVLSGYQDFEYAKGAIASGVCDYILKPIVPSEFVKTMNRLQEKLEDHYWQKRNRLLQKMCRGMAADREELQRYFGNGGYYVSLIRKNGLPRRITMSQEIEVYSIKQEQMLMYGRDVQEGLYLYPEELVRDLGIQSVVESMVRKHQDKVSYITAISSENSLQIEQVAEKIPVFYSALAEKTVPGKSQILFLEQIESSGNGNVLEMPGKAQKQERDPLQDVMVLLKGKKYEAVGECVSALIREWAKKEYPQLWLEGTIRQLFYLLRAEHYLDSTAEEVEFALEEAFYYATSMEELEASVLAQIGKKKKETVTQELKMDTPEYFQKIRDYIWQNLDQPLTLQQICRQFGISQPYLSRFFRKYEGTSFGNYLTQIRIQKAKDLLRQSKEILIKDVAFMVGYNDQFYFSRIFRSVVGVSPSEYSRAE